MNYNLHYNYIKLYANCETLEQTKAEENLIKQKGFKQFVVCVHSNFSKYQYQYILYIHPTNHQVYIHREIIYMIANGITTIKFCPASFEIQKILDEQNIEPKEGMKLFVDSDMKFKKCEYFQFCEQILNESDFE